ncbi:hypothetical protein [Comamonas composti]|uniref:hypothetical protein n=1 Tax=Comamonas composti TaxID=408558 RepID=UPI00041D1B7F|nr:hypothetical protein [Comamonas composti]
MLALSAPAQAYPFTLLPAGASLSPLLAAIGLSLLRRSWLGLLLSACVMALMLVLDGGELLRQGRKMPTDGRILQTQIQQARLLAALRAPEPLAEKTLDAHAVLKGSHGPLVFVNKGASASSRGLSLEQIARDPQALPANALLLSEAGGQASRAAAGLSGRSWVQGGLDGLLAAQKPDAGPLLQTLPLCRPGECVRVAVLSGDSPRWMGYERGLFEHALRLEDFFLPEHAPWSKLRQLSGNGRIPLVFAMLEPAHPQQPAQLLSWIKAQGMSHLHMVSHRVGGYYHDHYPSLSPETMRAFYGSFRRSLPAGQAEALCAHDVVLVTSLHANDLAVSRRPQAMDGCRIINLPAEGLLPQEIDDLVQAQKPLLQLRLGRVRYLGLYTDQIGFNALQMLRESMLRHGLAWIGESFGYEQERPWTGKMALAYDALALKIYRALYPNGGLIPLSHWLIATLAAVQILAYVLGGLTHRGLAALCFASLLATAGLAHHLWYYFPVHAGSRLAGTSGKVLELFSQNPYPMLILALIAGAATAFLRERARRPSNSKHGGLRQLARLGLKTPSGRILSSAKAGAAARAAARTGYPAIFRSNEQRHENHAARTMGAYASLVVHTQADLARLPAAWAAMAATPGSQPAFLVQPFMHFETTGVVRTGLMHQGRPHARVESSALAEGVTGNQSSQAQSRLLSLEHCLCSEEPLLRDIARIHQEWPQPLLLEFGLHAGRPVWLQMQRLEHNPLLLFESPEDGGFSPSPLAQELDTTAAGTPWLLSLMNASVPFTQWRLLDSQILERRRALAVCGKALAHCLPWSGWLWLAEQALRRTRQRVHAAPPAGCDLQRSLRQARALLLIDALALARGPSNSACAWASDAQVAHELQAVTSPYAQFASLGSLIRRDTPPGPTAPATQARRLRTSFAVREKLRQAMTYALAHLSCALQAQMQAQGLPPQALGLLTLDRLDSAGLRPDPSLLHSRPDSTLHATMIPGWKALGSTRISIDSPEDIRAACESLQGISDALVIARQPWLGLFSLAPHAACFQILSPVHHNSHFMQRAQAEGMGVLLGPQPHSHFTSS